MVRLDKKFLILFILVTAIFLTASLHYYHKTVQDDESISYVDFRVYYYAGFNLEANKNIYDISDGYFVYKYSPIFALAMSTLRFLTVTPAHALRIWYFILFVSFILSLYIIKEMLFRTTSGPTLGLFWIIPFLFIFRYLVVANFLNYIPSFWPPLVRACDKFLYILLIGYIASLFFIRGDDKENNYLAMMAVAVALNLRFLLLNIDRAQVNILVLLFISFFAYYMVDKKYARAGIYLGIATAFKLVPFIFIIYLLLKKKFKALFSSLATFAALLLIPSIKLGFSRNIELIRSWVNILTTTFPSESLDYKNQSLSAMLTRLFSRASSISILNLPQQYLWVPIAIIYMIFIICLSYTVIKKGRIKLERDEMAFDLSLFFVAMTILSPVGTKAAFIYMIFPIGLLVREAFGRRLKDIYINAGLLIYAASAYLNSSDIIGDLSIVLHRYSVMTFCLLVIFILTIYTKFTQEALTKS